VWCGCCIMIALLMRWLLHHELLLERLLHC